LVEVLWVQQRRLCLHRLDRHLHLLVLLERVHLCRLERVHLVRHGLGVLEHLVRLDPEELAHLEVPQVHHVLVVQREVLRVVLCREGRQVHLYQEVQLEDQWEHLCQVDRLEHRVLVDLLEHLDRLAQHLPMQVVLLVDLLLVVQLERLLLVVLLEHLLPVVQLVVHDLQVQLLFLKFLFKRVVPLVDL